MKTHELKIWPQWFDAVRLETKTFEVRKNDRNFSVGDKLVLEEFSQGVGEYTGRKVERIVSYMLEAGEIEEHDALKPGYVVLGIAPVPR